MLMEMFPDDVAAEVRDRRQHVNTVDRVACYITGELARYRDRVIASLHDKHAEHLLDSAPKNAVHAFVETESRVNSMMERLESMVAAFLQEPEPRQGRRQRRWGRDRRGEQCPRAEA